MYTDIDAERRNACIEIKCLWLPSSLVSCYDIGFEATWQFMTVFYATTTKKNSEALSEDLWHEARKLWTGSWLSSEVYSAWIFFLTSQDSSYIKSIITFTFLHVFATKLWKGRKIQRCSYSGHVWETFASYFIFERKVVCWRLKLWITSLLIPWINILNRLKEKKIENCKDWVSKAT